MTVARVYRVRQSGREWQVEAVQWLSHSGAGGYDRADGSWGLVATCGSELEARGYVREVNTRQTALLGADPGRAC